MSSYRISNTTCAIRRLFGCLVSHLWPWHHKRTPAWSATTKLEDFSSFPFPPLFLIDYFCANGTVIYRYRDYHCHPKAVITESAVTDLSQTPAIQTFVSIPPLRNAPLRHTLADRRTDADPLSIQAASGTIFPALIRHYRCQSPHAGTCALFCPPPPPARMRTIDKENAKEFI